MADIAFCSQPLPFFRSEASAGERALDAKATDHPHSLPLSAHSPLFLSLFRALNDVTVRENKRPVYRLG